MQKVMDRYRLEPHEIKPTLELLDLLKQSANETQASIAQMAWNDIQNRNPWTPAVAARIKGWADDFDWDCFELPATHGQTKGLSKQDILAQLRLKKDPTVVEFKSASK